MHAFVVAPAKGFTISVPSRACGALRGMPSHGLLLRSPVMTLSPIPPQTESKLRSLLAIALDPDAANADEKAFEVCRLIASLLETTAEEDGLTMARIVNADASLVHHTDKDVHPTAVIQLRIRRFCERYEVTLTNWRGRNLFPTVCMKCGHEPHLDVEDILIPHKFAHEDPRGWTHLHCADHWQVVAKAREDALGISRRVARTLEDDDEG